MKQRDVKLQKVGVDGMGYRVAVLNTWPVKTIIDKIVVILRSVLKISCNYYSNLKIESKNSRHVNIIFHYLMLQFPLTSKKLKATFK